MPITIKKGVMKYREPNGDYKGLDGISQEYTTQQIEAIQSAGQTQISNINSVLQEAKESGEFDGPQGPKGDTGDIGPQGPQGIPGITAIDDTSGSGDTDRTWSADKLVSEFSDLENAIPTVPTKVSQFENDSGYLTQHQDISNKADKTDIPTKVSELTNDSGYLISETDPTVPAWAKAAQKPTYTASEVGALPSNTHIPSTTAELTNDAGFITSSALPTKVSDLTNDAGYLTHHQDISGKANSADLSAVATSGDYADLSNKPTIPTVPVQDVQVDGASVLQNGIANIPIGSINTFGVFKRGSGLYDTNGVLGVNTSSEENIKGGSVGTFTSVNKQHIAAFYGLAKVAGHDEKDSAEPVGTYTPEAKAAIQSMLGVSDLIAPAENNLVASKAYAIGDIFIANGKLYKATAAIAQDAAIIPSVAGEEISGANCVETTLANENIKDVQIDGTSIIDQNGVANIPMGDYNTYGVIKLQRYGGLQLGSTNMLKTDPASEETIKIGTDGSRPIIPLRQHVSTFYGLAKAAGADMASSSNAVGAYTDEAKAAIQAMLGIDLSSIASQVEIPLVETVSGAAVTITGQPNTRYMCGEVTSISITPPAAGSIDVVFTSGSTVAVLTLPSTVKMPEWFDASTLDTNTVYEILITDGVYGSVMTWAT